MFLEDVTLDDSQLVLYSLKKVYGLEKWQVIMLTQLFAISAELKEMIFFSHGVHGCIWVFTQIYSLYIMYLTFIIYNKRMTGLLI